MTISLTRSKICLDGHYPPLLASRDPSDPPVPEFFASSKDEIYEAISIANRLDPDANFELIIYLRGAISG